MSTRLGKALGADRYLNYQSSAYQYGVYAGEAIDIALTLWNPTGAAGKILKAYWAVRAVAGGVEAGVAAWEGRYEDALVGGLGALLTLGRGLKGCGLAKMLGGRAGGAGRVLALGLAGYGIYRGAELAGQRFEDGDYLGAALALGQAAADVYALSRTCFTAETPLLTPTGSKPIAQFVPGDLVLSRDEMNVHGPVEAKMVEEVFVTLGRIFHLHVGGKVIRTTPEHPFYAEGKGWTAAAELQVGDRLALRDGWAAVEDVLDTGEYEIVYNLRVSEYHTYFVGSVDWGFGVWAHNLYNEGRVRRAIKKVSPKTKVSSHIAHQVAVALKKGTPYREAQAAALLQTLPGIGPKNAQKIINALKRQHGPAARLDRVRTARDQLARTLGRLPGNRRPAAVTAGYHTETGRVAARASGNRRCAEAHVVDALGGDRSKVRFTEAVRPRAHRPPFHQVPVCFRCEGLDGRAPFPTRTTLFESDIVGGGSGI